MTRYKKYLKSKGYKFNEDYDYMPWDNYHKQREVLEEADCYISNNNELLMFFCWDVADITDKVERNGDIHTISFE